MNIYMIFLLGEDGCKANGYYNFVMVSVSEEQAIERLKEERTDIDFENYHIDIVKHDVEEIISL